MTDKFVTMGRIAGVFGVKGWLRVKPYTESLASLVDYEQWFIKVKGQWQTMNVEACQIHGSGLIAKFEGVEDRDQAALLTRCDIAVELGFLPTLDAEEFYWHQLVGLNVLNKAGYLFGQIKEMIETGANDVMLIQGPASSDNKVKSLEVLIPYIKDKVVMQVDLEAREILVDWDESWV